MSADSKDKDDKGSGGDGKTTTIIVNTREKDVERKEMTFDQIVGLAFENPPTGENIEITIAYRRGHGDKPSGTMHPNEPVKVKEGMIFDVTATDKS